jgi:hypothetical protein
MWRFSHRNHKRHIQLSGQSPLRGKSARSCPGFGLLAQPLRIFSFMGAQDVIGKLKIIGGCALAIAAVWICALIVTSLALRKTDETVTVDSNRHISSPPAISSAPPPQADSDLEVVGDQIAKAIVHLNRGRREAALRALDQAQTVSRRALANHQSADTVNERLKLALRETEQARLQIAHGKPGAAAIALRKLARQLDAG